jgi:hypothetical protein
LKNIATNGWKGNSKFNLNEYFEDNTPDRKDLTLLNTYSIDPDGCVDIDDAISIEKIEDIFYPCLAMELLAENHNTQKLEFQYYDSFQDIYYTAILSTNWMEALEDLANNHNMTDTLEQILDNTILEMENNPNLWENEYLPKLRQFPEKLKKIPENAPNFPYIQTVYTSPDNKQPKVREGVINRFWKRIEQKLSISKITKIVRRE